jgi:hypothetical protein
MATAEYVDMKLPPWVSAERREMWKGIIYDAVLSSLIAYEGLEAAGPKVIRTFCTGCTQPFRAREKHLGRKVRCPSCGKEQWLRFGRN